jgi:predicted  nucleic acid-binding Zn-ribbon protein
MNCDKEYGEDAEELVDGCECGSTLFLYQKDNSSDTEGEEEAEEETMPVEKDEVLEEIDEFLTSIKEGKKGAGDTKIRFDLQSIRVLEEGVYEIDLKKLLDEIPLIVEIKDGNYHLHLPSVFKEGKEKNLSLKELENAEEDLSELME